MSTEHIAACPRCNSVNFDCKPGWQVGAFGEIEEASWLWCRCFDCDKEWTDHPALDESEKCK